MSEAGKISVGVYADTKNFEKGVRKVDTGSKAMERDIKKLGKTIEANANKFAKWGGAIAGIAFTALTKKVIDATRKQEQAFAQLEQGIRTTNAVVGFSAQELANWAQEFQKATTFGDEDIIAAQAQLVSFTQIVGDEFNKTMELAADLSVRFGTDLKSSVLQLGKALNDPVANLSALSRSGIQFSNAQKDMIKDLVESNRLVDAQNIILKELEVQFGGSARAARDTFGGAVQGLSNAFGDLLEGGTGLNEAKDRVEELTSLLQDPETIKAAQELTGALISGFTKLVEAMSKVPDFAEWLGETAAKAVVGADTELGKYEERLIAVQKQLKAFTTDQNGFVTSFHDGRNVWTESNADISALHLRYIALQEEAKNLKNEMMKLQEQPPVPKVEETTAETTSGGQGGSGGEPPVDLAAEAKKQGQAYLDAVIESQNAIRTARIASYTAQLEDLKKSLDNNLITQTEYDRASAELEQQRSDVVNGIVRMTFEQQQNALARHSERMAELGLALQQLNKDLAGDKIDPEEYDKKLKQLQEKLADHKLAMAELEKVELDNGEEQLDPIESYQQETVGLLEAMGLRFQSQEEMQLAANARELEILENQLNNKLITEEQYAERSAQLKRTSAELERNILKGSLQEGFKIMASGSKKIAKIQEAMALYQAGVKGAQSAVDAWQAGMSTGGPFAPVVAAAYTAASLAKTAMLIKQIKGGGQSRGGSGGVSSGGLPTPASAAPAAQGGESGGTRVFNIDFVGESGMNTQQTRNLLELINEQSGDNVEINLRG